MNVLTCAAGLALIVAAGPSTADDTGAEGRIKEERTMPVHRIKVRSVRMVASTCP
jgi:hypothetical protein